MTKIRGAASEFTPLEEAELFGEAIGAVTRDFATELGEQRAASRIYRERTDQTINKLENRLIFWEIIACIGWLGWTVYAYVQ